MADQLLSQSDVDALIASLSKNDPPKPAPAAPATATKPASASATNPVAAASVSAPKPAPFNMSMPVSSVPRTATAPVKPEASSDQINNLNATIAELTRQVNSMSAAMRRLETLEKKMADVEAKNTRSNPASTDLKIQQLTDEMKKIIGNLKGTPGYGVKNTFACDKCNDHGHVAVQFRCTSCGHERWYGWWPEKKK
jgi:uncharacterized coiled-coil protein SlyX